MSDDSGLSRTLIVNTGAMRSLDNAERAALAGDDRELEAFLQAVKVKLEAGGLKDRELRLTTLTGLDGPEYRLAVGPPSKVDEPDPDPELVVVGATPAELVEELEEALAIPDGDGPRPAPEHGADEPTISGTGERLLDEAGYAGMRRAVLEVSRALGAIEADLFDALIATAERSIGPGLDQAVAAGEVPLDQLGPAREALELELRLFRCARTFRTGVGSVQDAVRRHQKAEEERAGAPPAIEVIRHNAPKNGGGT